MLTWNYKLKFKDERGPELLHEIFREEIEESVLPIGNAVVAVKTMCGRQLIVVDVDEPLHFR